MASPGFWKLRIRFWNLRIALRISSLSFLNLFEKHLKKGQKRLKMAFYALLFLAQIAIAKNISEAQITIVKNNILSWGWEIAIF